MTNPKAYYRRSLPHFHPPEGTFQVVFRLAGSLPQGVIERLRTERAAEEKFLSGIGDVRRLRDAWSDHHVEYFEKFDAVLDAAGTGPRWLNTPDVAAAVMEAMKYRDSKVYDLLACSIMPNHVHMVFIVGRPDWSSYNVETAPSPGRGRRPSSTAVSDILESLKWNTALKCNRVLTRSGQFWQHESYDHLIRDGEELERTIWYVLHNPVKAGLVDSWEYWKWNYLKPDLL